MKLRYQTILFDMDGTLTDSFEGITKSVAYALRRFGMDAPDYTQLGGFVGPPLQEHFRETYHFSDEELQRVVGFYREYFMKKGILQNRVYDGLPPLLKKLRENGAALAVASTKPQVSVDSVLKMFGLTEVFDTALGSMLDGSRTDKAELIEDVLQMLRVPDRKDVLMVGDRKYDAAGAKTAGVDFCGALYGYGGREELDGYPHVFLAESVTSLAQFLLGQK